MKYNYTATELNKKTKDELINIILGLQVGIDVLATIACPNQNIDELAKKNVSVEKSEERSAKKQGKTPSAEPKKSAIAEPKKSAEKSADRKTRTWEEKTIVIVNDGKCVEYAEKDGKYVYDKGIRMFVNNLLKAQGATWDKENKVWVCPDTETAENISGELVVTAKEIDAYMEAKAEKWAEKAAEKAAKTAKAGK